MPRSPRVTSDFAGTAGPEQIARSATASGIELDDEAVDCIGCIDRIDRILEPVIERDPRRTRAQPTDFRC